MLQSSFDSENNRHKAFELPGAKPHYNPDRPGQVEHIFLDLSLDIPHQSYNGTCTIQLLPVRSGIERLTLDAVNLNIQSVQVDSKQQQFDYDGEQLHIQLNPPTQIDQSVTIAIAYSVEKPQRGIYFIQPNEHLPQQTYPSLDSGGRRRLALLVSLLRLPRATSYLRNSGQSSQAFHCYFQWTANSHPGRRQRQNLSLVTRASPSHLLDDPGSRRFCRTSR